MVPQPQHKLSRSDLLSLEQYAEARPTFRQRVMAHKKLRQIELGPHARLFFEDRLTIQYQIQEMLRVERIFEASGIEEELAAYNPLIPDGANWKATLMIEYPDVDERRAALARMPGVEHTVWVRIGDGERRFAHANEDMERSTDEKAAAVHFLRFELPSADVAAAKAGADVHMGIDHVELPYSITLDDAQAQCLAADLS